MPTLSSSQHRTARFQSSVGGAEMSVMALHGFAGRWQMWGQVAAAAGVALQGPGLERLGLETADRDAESTSASTVWQATDLPGHGAAAPPAAADFESMVAGVGRQLDVVGAHGARDGGNGGGGPWHLIGYSLGARLAAGVALAFPGKVAQLTLIGMHPGLADGAQAARDDRWASDLRWVRVLEHEGVEAFAKAWAAQPIFASQGTRLSKVARSAQQQWRGSHNARALARAMAAASLARMPDHRAGLARLAIPVHLIAGADDAKYVALARELLPTLRHGQLTVLSGCGHNPLLEVPEALAAVLTNKVEKGGGHASS